MSNETTIEQVNEVIAEFMGYYHEGMEPDYSQYACSAFVADAKYHTSWDWLMPVVEKIENPEVNEKNNIILRSAAIVKILYKACVIEYEPDEESGDTNDEMAFQTSGQTKIEAVYSAVYQFIQWLNQQKQNNETGFDYKSREWEKEQMQPASEEAIRRMKERWVSEGKRECPDCGLWFKSEGRCPECNPMG